jgi:hypothetical protein
MSHKSNELENLVWEYFEACQNNDQREKERLKGMVVSTLIIDGWPEYYVQDVVSNIETANNKRDVIKLIARYQKNFMIEQDTMTQDRVRYKASILIPVVYEPDARNRVIGLLQFLKEKGFKVYDKKAVVSDSYNVDPENSVVNIKVDVTFDTTKDRYQTKRIIEQKYQILSLNYNKKDAL